MKGTTGTQDCAGQVARSGEGVHDQAAASWRERHRHHQATPRRACAFFVSLSVWYLIPSMLAFRLRFGQVKGRISSRLGAGFGQFPDPASHRPRQSRRSTPGSGNPSKQTARGCDFFVSLSVWYLIPSMLAFRLRFGQVKGRISSRSASDEGNATRLRGSSGEKRRRRTRSGCSKLARAAPPSSSNSLLQPDRVRLLRFSPLDPRSLVVVAESIQVPPQLVHHQATPRRT
jgi:hypothetical protein